MMFRSLGRKNICKFKSSSAKSGWDGHPNMQKSNWMIFPGNPGEKNDSWNHHRVYQNALILVPMENVVVGIFRKPTWEFFM